MSDDRLTAHPRTIAPGTDVTFMWSFSEAREIQGVCDLVPASDIAVTAFIAGSLHLLATPGLFIPEEYGVFYMRPYVLAANEPLVLRVRNTSRHLTTQLAPTIIPANTHG